MQDTNWKTWIIVGVIAMGGTFELIKHLPAGGHSPLMDKENLRYGDDESPYSVRHVRNSARRQEPRPVHVAANSPALEEQLKKFNEANVNAQTEAEHKTAKAKTKKDDDEYEIVTDPVTGKKVRRKKKKEAKKEEKKPEVAKAVEIKIPEPEEPEEEDADAEIAAALADAAKGGTAGNPVPKNPERDILTAHEWERQLMQRPDLQQTRQFIQAYKSHTVTPDTYYKITKMMVQDSRPEMKQLGILCASSAPSTTSFQILVGVAKSTSSSATLQQQANTALKAYTQPANLGYLQGALRGTDTNSALVAAQLLDQAIQVALQQQQNHPSPTNPSPDPRAQGTAGPTALQTRFQPFRPLLTVLSNSPDATLAAQARQTLNNLQALLAGSPTSNIASTP